MLQGSYTPRLQIPVLKASPIFTLIPAEVKTEFALNSNCDFCTVLMETTLAEGAH
jgi:hypothetical protein